MHIYQYPPIDALIPLLKKGVVWLALLLSVFGSNVAGASDRTSVAPAETPSKYRLAVELDLIQPFVPTVRIIRPKITLTLWGDIGKMRGDLVLGLYIRPHIRHDLLYRIDEYMGTVGYRQYFWRGLHMEVLASAGAAWGRNRYDKKYYKTPTLFFDVNAGYRFDFFVPGGFFDEKQGRVGFFVAPQGGVLFSGGISDIGPRRGKPDVFAQGTLLLGLIF